MRRWSFTARALAARIRSDTADSAARAPTPPSPSHVIVNPRGPIAIAAGTDDHVPARVAGAMPGGPPLRIVMRRGLEVRGRLVDASGAPLPRTLLIFEHPEDRGLGRTVFTDEGGRFSIGGFVAATYRVVTPGRKNVAAVEVGTVEPASQGDVELRVP